MTAHTGPTEAPGPQPQAEPASPLDAVTVLRSRSGGPINKIGRIEGDELIKDFAHNDGAFVAQTVHVPDPTVMVELLRRSASTRR